MGYRGGLRAAAEQQDQSAHSAAGFGVTIHLHGAESSKPDTGDCGRGPATASTVAPVDRSQGSSTRQDDKVHRTKWVHTECGWKAGGRLLLTRVTWAEMGFLFCWPPCVARCAEPVKGSLRRQRTPSLTEPAQRTEEIYASKKETLVDINPASHGRPRSKARRFAVRSLDTGLPASADCSAIGGILAFPLRVSSSR